MIVARHEMPGKRADVTRPVLSATARMATEEGNGVMYGPQSCSQYETAQTHHPDHTVLYGTDPRWRLFQAFHAWLPSFRPYGTEVTLP